MFGFLKKLATGKPAWNGLLGWQVMTYEEGDQWLSLQIEPMLHGPCKVYVPDQNGWAAEAPPWAAARRDEILQRLKGKAWNRDLAWEGSPRSKFWPRHVSDPWESSLEATSGGRQMAELRMFDENPGRISKADAKKAWCKATEAMCMQIRGPVDLYETEIIPGSVFQEVAIPALRRNPAAQVDIRSAA